MENILEGESTFMPWYWSFEEFKQLYVFFSEQDPSFIGKFPES